MNEYFLKYESKRKKIIIFSSIIGGIIFMSIILFFIILSDIKETEIIHITDEKQLNEKICEIPYAKDFFNQIDSINNHPIKESVYKKNYKKVFSVLLYESISIHMELDDASYQETKDDILESMFFIGTYHEIYKNYDIFLSVNLTKNNENYILDKSDGVIVYNDELKIDNSSYMFICVNDDSNSITLLYIYSQPMDDFYTIKIEDEIKYFYWWE